jgi:hypothetical protein
MKNVAIIVPISPNDGFLSQVAAIRNALTRLEWQRWTWQLHVCTSGHLEQGLLERWQEHIPEVSFSLASTARFEEEGDWAQSDDQLRCAPRDADVILALDADVLPVANFEHMLDHVHDADCVAGVVAHFRFPGWPGQTQHQDWENVAKGLLTKPLDYNCSYTLVSPDKPDEERLAPFYLNFGVVFFSANALQSVLPTFLHMRHALDTTMPNPAFSAQVALTLALAEKEVKTLALPMRYNFPNDDAAAVIYPEEADQVLFWHYLRTKKFNRQKIFTSPEEYGHFVTMDLEGMNSRFQQSAIRLLGRDWPFA